MGFCVHIVPIFPPDIVDVRSAERLRREKTWSPARYRWPTRVLRRAFQTLASSATGQPPPTERKHTGGAAADSPRQDTTIYYLMHICTYVNYRD